MSKSGGYLLTLEPGHRRVCVSNAVLWRLPYFRGLERFGGQQERLTLWLDNADEVDACLTVFRLLHDERDGGHGTYLREHVENILAILSVCRRFHADAIWRSAFKAARKFAWTCPESLAALVAFVNARENHLAASCRHPTRDAWLAPLLSWMRYRGDDLPHAVWPNLPSWVLMQLVYASGEANMGAVQTALEARRRCLWAESSLVGWDALLVSRGSSLNTNAPEASRPPLCLDAVVRTRVSRHDSEKGPKPAPTPIPRRLSAGSEHSQLLPPRLPLSRLGREAGGWRLFADCSVVYRALCGGALGEYVGSPGGLQARVSLRPDGQDQQHVCVSIVGGILAHRPTANVQGYLHIQLPPPTHAALLEGPPFECVPEHLLQPTWFFRCLAPDCDRFEVARFTLPNRILDSVSRLRVLLDVVSSHTPS